MCSANNIRTTLHVALNLPSIIVSRLCFEKLPSRRNATTKAFPKEFISIANYIFSELWNHRIQSVFGLTLSHRLHV